MARQSNKSAKPAKLAVPVYVWVILGIAVILGVALLVPFGKSTPAGAMPSEISVDEAAKMKAEGAFFLDVREQSEWDQFHLAGATLIPLGTLPNELYKVPKDQKIVVYCRSGNRSATGRDILLKAGYTNVTSMAGGIKDWQSKGLPVETGN